MPKFYSRKLFHDEALQTKFEQDGYVVVPFLSTEQISAIHQVFEEEKSGINKGFYTSLFSQDAEYKKRVDQRVREHCDKAPDNYLIHYKPLVANFTVKEPGPESELAVHQDWTIVDEAQYPSINCWFPVTPISLDNGPMYVMKGSHRFIKGLRGSPYFPTQLDNLRSEIIEHYLTPVVIQPGEAILHDNRLVHYSPANKTDAVRVAVCLNMIPEEAEPIHYFRSNEGKVEKYQVDHAFFTSFNIGEKPDYPLLEVVEDLGYQEISTAELSTLYAGKATTKIQEKSSFWSGLKKLFTRN